MGAALQLDSASAVPVRIECELLGSLAQEGDLILVKTPRAGYGLGRWVAGSPYDHVGVIVGGARVVNIVRPRAVLTPLARMLRTERSPLLLRPAFGSSAARARFVASLEQVADAPYDLGRTLTLLPRLLIRRATGVNLPMGPLGVDRLICTDAILARLRAEVAGFERVDSLPLDWVELGCGTTDDFLKIHRAFPELLAQVG